MNRPPNINESSAGRLNFFPAERSDGAEEVGALTLGLTLTADVYTQGHNDAGKVTKARTVNLTWKSWRRE